MNADADTAAGGPCDADRQGATGEGRGELASFRPERQKIPQSFSLSLAVPTVSRFCCSVLVIRTLLMECNLK